MNIEQLLINIDRTKMERKWVDIYDMCEREFDIYEHIEQPEDNVRLTYCYYHRWICTDTEVGIRVWYLDGVPVCVSWKPYRKSNEEYGWINEESFHNVRKYLESLREKETMQVQNILENDELEHIIDAFKGIDHKQHEVINTI
jgi:hypothetical protein